MEKPGLYHVTYLPLAESLRLQAKHGKHWMDADPEWLFETKHFATEKAARDFAASDACCSTFNEAYVKRNLRRETFDDDDVPVGGWEWDEEALA